MHAASVGCVCRSLGFRDESFVLGPGFRIQDPGFRAGVWGSGLSISNGSRLKGMVFLSNLTACKIPGPNRTPNNQPILTTSPSMPLRDLT